jgi:uncharacterized protein YndB with AHSA1/START domain
VVQIRNSVQIDRPREVVFDFLSDPRNELRWNPKVEVMEKITEGPLGVGSKFKAKWTKSKLVTMECEHFERPSAWRYRNDGPVVVDLSIALEESGDGTMLTSCFDATPRGAFRLVFPIFLAMMRREEAANMRLLKQAVEAL